MNADFFKHCQETGYLDIGLPQVAVLNPIMFNLCRVDVTELGNKEEKKKNYKDIWTRYIG